MNYRINGSSTHSHSLFANACSSLGLTPVIIITEWLASPYQIYILIYRQENEKAHFVKYVSHLFESKHFNYIQWIKMSKNLHESFLHANCQKCNSKTPSHILYKSRQLYLCNSLSQVYLIHFWLVWGRNKAYQEFCSAQTVVEELLAPHEVIYLIEQFDL